MRVIDGVADRPSSVAGGTAFFYRGKEVAHFHHAHEWDLRLTKKVIQALGLVHPADSIYHLPIDPPIPPGWKCDLITLLSLLAR